MIFEINKGRDCLRLHESIFELNKDAWSKLSGAEQPFCRYEFLAALESSGSIGTGPEKSAYPYGKSKQGNGNSGWLPRHAAMYHDEELVAVLILFEKQHSRGEYVFDQAWAQAYKQYGMPYYPKWVSAIPFTPITGARLLLKHSEAKPSLTENKKASGIQTPPLQPTSPIKPETTADITLQLQQRFFRLFLRALKQSTSSGWHCLFSQTDYSSTLQQLEQETPSPQHNTLPPLAISSAKKAPVDEELRFCSRHDVQFHWHNKQYHDFAHFLQSLRSAKRKQIKKERKNLTGLTISRLLGTQMSSQQWQQFYQCYCNTYAERGMPAYLSAQFFTDLARTMGRNMLIVEACLSPKQEADRDSLSNSLNNKIDDEENSNAIAYALYFFDDTTLYGRYWGSTMAIDGLHFECCYYQGIEFCIENNLPLFNAGAQGEHKIPRGFEPVVLSSQHCLKPTMLSDAIENFCSSEEKAVHDYALWAKEKSPFKRGES